ncbi:uncharacterized protein LOC107006477 [Solanum pennellii]|uniref:Uncharacterized protein LOC107006477 n=1 Tax=Solanum pennellii TaxID=28526 RepID=A0ABM1FR31_SOLPN|nr:uncharacterized protein LOC107006477 [Solanum pennellii]
MEYLTVKDPLKLRTDLKGRYDHLKATVLPRARYEWMHLQFQDFKTQQYREKGFQIYSKLISCVLVDEQLNAFLMKNHEVSPTGAAPLPEANVVGALDQSEALSSKRKGNKSGASSSNARAESHMTLKDDKPRTSQKYDKDVEENLALKDDIFDDLSEIIHMEVDDFFGDRN